MQPFDPIRHTPITDPIGYAQRIVHQQQQAAAAAAAAGRSPATVGAPSESGRARADEARNRARAERDPATVERVINGCLELVQRFPNDAVPVVAEVQVPSKVPGRRPATGYAEVGRAWPIGAFQYMYKDSLVMGSFGVMTDREIVRLDAYGHAPTVELTPKMRWMSVRSQRPWGHWVVDALSKVEHDLAERQGRAGDVLRPATELSGSVSASANRKAEALRRKQVELVRLHRKTFELYGTRDNPKVQGPPTRHVKKRWSEAYAAEAKVQRMNEQIRRLGVDKPALSVIPDVLR